MTADSDDKTRSYVMQAVSDAAAEIDKLLSELRAKAVTMLAANYDLQIKQPSSGQGRGYGYRYARKRTY